MSKFLSIPRSPIVVIGGGFLVVVLVLVVFDSTKIQRTHVNLHQLFEGVSRFARDNGGRLPDMSDMAAVERSLYPKYVKSRSVFYDPYTNRYFKTNPSLSFRSINSLQKLPCPPVLFSSSESPPRDRLFASGQGTQPDACKSTN